jgi:CubicO group peptidase (beta-lactamase class C family)
MIESLAKIPLEFSPGEAWNYSVSTDVLGYLIGKISGMPFEQFLKARILDPLGMTDTDFHVPTSKAHRFAACYSADPKGGMTFHAADRKGTLTLQDDPAKSSFLSPPSFISGGGGLCSTVADYLTFCRTLLNRGELDGVRLIGPKTLALMTSNHLPGGCDLPAMSRSLFSEATYNGIGFGLGFAVTMNPALTNTGAHVVAAFETEAARNTFTRLPVRESETVLVWLAAFRDARQFEDHVRALRDLPDWRRHAPQDVLRQFSRKPEVLKLAPTPRSRLKKPD